MPGPITISLRDVPFDQALNTILSLKGLAYVPVGNNIIRVLTPAQLTQERGNAVTYTKVFSLNYAKADDVKTKLDSIRGVEGRKGIINIDSRTNALIVTDALDGLEACESLIRQLNISRTR